MIWRRLHGTNERNEFLGGRRRPSPFLAQGQKSASSKQFSYSSAGG
jgi:hypothetical protein